MKFNSALSPAFGGGATESILHPVVLIAFIIAVIAIVLLPRSKTAIPVLGMAFLVPLAQQFYIAGIHLFVLRAILLIALVRVLAGSQGKKLAGGWNGIDTACTAYVLCMMVGVIVRHPELEAVINQVGFGWDCLGAYFLFRALIQSEDDFYPILKFLALITVIQGCGMLIEQEKMINLFGLLHGGPPEVPELREGRVRAQGVFFHPLTAGAFAATVVPLFVLLWKNGKARIVAAFGIIAATIMTFGTQTSTSLMSLVAGVGAILAWPIRKNMRAVRLTVVAALVILNFVMTSPVWWLIGHIDVTGSSSSYQRALLVDQFIRHFSSWFLVGGESSSWGWDMWDVQNQYVQVGLAGGILAFALFLTVLTRAFSRMGKQLKRAGSRREEWLFWLLGSALFVCMVSFFGVNYFDQVKVIWFVLLAMVAAAKTATFVPVTHSSDAVEDRDAAVADLQTSAWAMD